jgi:hypothetical protein
MDILQIVKLRVVAAALWVGSLLTGCSGDEDPRTLPPLPSASPTTAPALPVPSAAAAATPEGAAAFTRYYLELLNEAFRSDDASAVRAVSDSGCGGCVNLIGAIEAPSEAGERTEGGEYVLKFAEAPPVEAGDVIVELRYSLTELRVLNAEGRVIDRKPPVDKVDAQMRLLRRGDTWLVAGFRDVKP